MILVEYEVYINLAALRTLINLNQPVVNVMLNEPIWKIVVLDKYGQDIISPLISVKQLRELGVTLHLWVFFCFSIFFFLSF